MPSGKGRGVLVRDEGRLRVVRTAELATGELSVLRRLAWEAFAVGDRMTEDDWAHALGGLHVILEIGGEPVAHAAIVERGILIGDREFRTGYVEAVATAPGRQRQGFGTRVMAEVGAQIRAGFELGALDTGAQGFYTRLGWLAWRGPTFVRTAAGIQRTPEEDGFVMVLPTPASGPLDVLDPEAPISCDWREGDVW
jgi:aminoglycoside 2'-N-acetyltransferase I